MKKQNMKMVIIGLVLIAISLLLMLEPYYTWAQEQSGNPCAFDVEAELDDGYLFKIERMNPGDVESRTITVVKTGSASANLYMFWEWDDGDPWIDQPYNLFDQLVMTIFLDEELFYTGSMVGGEIDGETVTLDDLLLIAFMGQGDEITLDIIVTLPGPTTGNEYQGAHMLAKLVFVTDCGSDQQAASLGDFVWVDANRNGIQDPGEAGVNGVTVRLLDAGGNVIRTTVTASDGTGRPGYYLFDNLPPGTYSVQFVLPAGYRFTERNADGRGISGPHNSDANLSTGRSATVTLAAGDAVRYVDAGIYQEVSIHSLASLGEFVWHDLNRNGLHDPGEPGLNGVTVRLLNANGNVIATAVTANDSNGNPGYYRFNNLTPGTYSVQFIAPPGYIFTTQNLDGLGISGHKNSTADPETGITIQVNLSAGENILYLDAGLYFLQSEEVIEPEEPETDPELIIISPEDPQIDPPLPRTDGASLGFFFIGLLFLIIGILLRKSLSEDTVAG